MQVKWFLSLHFLGCRKRRCSKTQNRQVSLATQSQDSHWTAWEGTSWTDPMHLSKFVVLKHTKEGLFVVHWGLGFFLRRNWRNRKLTFIIDERKCFTAVHLHTLRQKFGIICRQLWICTIWHVQNTPLLLGHNRLLWPNAGKWGRETKAQIRCSPLSEG